MSSRLILKIILIPGSIMTVSATVTTCPRTATRSPPWTRRHQSPAPAWTGTTGRRGRNSTRLRARRGGGTVKRRRMARSWSYRTSTPPRGTRDGITTTTTTANRGIPTGIRRIGPSIIINLGTKRHTAVVCWVCYSSFDGQKIVW